VISVGLSWREALSAKRCSSPVRRGPSDLSARDREHDPIVYTALPAEADYLIGDDRDVVPDRREQHYEHEGHQLAAAVEVDDESEACRYMPLPNR
jgi:hypothetical protein